MSPVSIFILSAAVILVLAVIVMYNSLVRKEKLTEEAWSGIDVQLKRRWDLIPNLVETVKGYAKHESSTLENVIAQRNMCQNAKSIDDKIGQEGILAGMLKSVFALSENYPELKADANFRELQKTLSSLEDEIQMSRRYYNANVRDFNTQVKLFPVNMIAGTFGFKTKPFFEIADAKEKEAVAVKF